MRARPTSCVSTIIASVILLSAASVATAQPCQPHWNTTAPLIGDPGLFGAVRAITVFDDGTGPALYAGGNFTISGVAEPNIVAKWDGSSWTPLANNLLGAEGISSLAVFDDGAGPALYAGGSFKVIGGISTNAIAKWDGSTWSKLGSGSGIRTPSAFSAVFTLAVFDDGSGPALYLGGNFLHAGGFVAHSIAKWDGTTWSTLDTGLFGVVEALTVFDDGTGPALYAGGLFENASNTPVNSIAKWDGSLWSPLGSGMQPHSQAVFALDVFDDGSGPALYAGGNFMTAGGVEANDIAKWDGSSWSALGNITGSFIRTMTAFNDGAGPALYVGGFFVNSSQSSLVTSLARWDGMSWSEAGVGIGGFLSSSVEALAVYDDGDGPSLFVGGTFSNTGDVTSNFIAEWVGCATSTPGDVNGDGVVNGADLASLLTDWGACPPTGACPDDLTKDGVVNAADLAFLLANWSP